MYWYCFFTKTGYEQTALNEFKMKLDPSRHMSFIPIAEYYFRRGGIPTTINKPLFPGYVFLRTNTPDDEIVHQTRSVIDSHRTVYYLLQYADTLYSIVDSDRQLLLQLLDREYRIRQSFGMIEGDRVKINSGPLVGMESVIQKINRHKRRAIMQLNFMGSPRTIEVGLEITEKITRI
jgi:transcription termination/antitermination protein NusG